MFKGKSSNCSYPGFKELVNFAGIIDTEEKDPVYGGLYHRRSELTANKISLLWRLFMNAAAK